MSIRKKLLISYIAMIVIPVVLFALTVVLLLTVLFRQSNDGGGSPMFHNPMERDSWLSGLLFAVEQDPRLWTDARFLAAADRQLDRQATRMVVEKGGTLLYASPQLGADVPLDRLQHYAAEGDPGRVQGPPWLPRGKLAVGGASYAVDRQAIKFADGSAGAVYWLKDNGRTERFFRTVFPLLFLSMLLAIALTNGLLTSLVSRSIIRPLRMLKQAAEHIKDGDLDQALPPFKKDEIGQLGEAFEEMRLRLKESIALQLQYEENRKEMLSNISHDLKTPIAAISGCVEGLRDGIADTPEKRLKYIDMIHRKISDMDRMIDELLLFSKLDLNRAPFDFERIDLAAFVRDWAAETQADPRFRDVRLRFDFPPDRTVPATVDREKLGRALANIADNSLKYMDKADKEIRFELLPGKTETTLLVRDNGRGIDPEALPHVFERFYRADPSRSPEAGGSGLGLAIVKQIVESHGGRVWAESVPGCGTTIVLTLPNGDTEEGEALEKDTHH